MASWLHRGSIAAPSRLHRGSIVAPSWLHRGSIVAPSWIRGTLHYRVTTNVEEVAYDESEKVVMPLFRIGDKQLLKLRGPRVLIEDNILQCKLYSVLGGIVGSKMLVGTVRTAYSTVLRSA